MSALVTELLFNMMIDWLQPVEFDGSTHVSLPVNDPRLRLPSLLQWEANNLLRALRHLAALLAPLKGFLIESVARDKAFRLVQYTLRFVEHGVLPKLAGGRVELAAKLRRLQLTLSTTRRTMGFLELSAIVGLVAPLAEPDGASNALRLTSRLAITGLSVFDRARLLQEHGLLPGKASVTGRRAMLLLSAFHACNVLRLLLRAGRTEEAAQRLRSLVRWVSGGADAAAGSTSGENGGTGARTCTCTSGQNGSTGTCTGNASASAAEMRYHLRAALKEVLCLLQALHLAGRRRLFRTSDAAVGLLGMITSSWDLSQLLDARSCTAPPPPLEQPPALRLARPSKKQALTQ